MIIQRFLNDLLLAGLKVERQLEPVFRDQFDDLCRGPLFGLLQRSLLFGRPDRHLALAQEDPPEDEERYIQAVIDELRGFVTETWPQGHMQRFGNTKTFGVLRGEFEVDGGLPDNLAIGVFSEPRALPAWVRFSGPGPYWPPDLEDYGQCSCGIKLMGVDGPKLLDDEQRTQDLLLVTPASFVTPDIVENSKLQKHVRAGTQIFYFLDPRDSHLRHMLLQALYSRTHANPLELPYYSNVPFLLGDGQAVQYSLRPITLKRTRPPMKLSPNHLREAMVKTLAEKDVEFEFRVQVQTDSHRMPIEDATIHWPEKLSPYVRVATLKIPRQQFDSDAQIAFADHLSYNPWHSLPEHRPLGSSNRARRRMYYELAQLRQQWNGRPHIEPTGEEQFDADELGRSIEDRLATA
jgi:predicted DCC family thiol-disulfide oxidoreductase YuxK